MAANEINNVIEIIEDLHVDDEKREQRKFYEAVMDDLGSRLSELLDEVTDMKEELKDLEDDALSHLYFEEGHRLKALQDSIRSNTIMTLKDDIKSYELRISEIRDIRDRITDSFLESYPEEENQDMIDEDERYYADEDEDSDEGDSEDDNGNLYLDEVSMYPDQIVENPVILAPRNYSIEWKCYCCGDKCLPEYYRDEEDDIDKYQTPDEKE